MSLFASDLSQMLCGEVELPLLFLMVLWGGHFSAFSLEMGINCKEEKEVAKEHQSKEVKRIRQVYKSQILEFMMHLGKVYVRRCKLPKCTMHLQSSVVLLCLFCHGILFSVFC